MIIDSEGIYGMEEKKTSGVSGGNNTGMDC